MSKYILTRPVEVEAIRWTGHNAHAVRAMGIDDPSALPHDVWVVQDGDTVTVLSQADFDSQYVRASVEDHASAQAVAAVADALAIEGGLD
jgi:hypothetical protein